MKRACLAAIGLMLAGCPTPVSSDGGDATPNDAANDGVDRVNDTSADGTDAAPPVDCLGCIQDVQDVDVPIGPDVVNDVVLDASEDVQPSDVTATDATDTAPCTDPVPTITITHPASGAVIETCSASGTVSVYYDFITTTTGSISSIQVNWLIGTTPFGPPWTLPGPSPYTAHRLVGGPDTTTQTALFRASGSLSSTWQFVATGTDACGRTVSTMIPFTLHYENRSSMCPNP